MGWLGTKLYHSNSDWLMLKSLLNNDYQSQSPQIIQWWIRTKLNKLGPVNTDSSCSGGQRCRDGRRGERKSRFDWISEEKTTAVWVLMAPWALPFLLLLPCPHLCIRHLSAVRLPPNGTTIVTPFYHPWLFRYRCPLLARWSYCLVKWFKPPLSEGFSTQILQLPPIPSNYLFLAKYIPSHSLCLFLPISLLFHSHIQVCSCVER